MKNKDFFAALDELEKTKGIKKEEYLNYMETAMVAAYNKNFGESKSITVKLDPDKNEIRFYAYKTVVEDEEYVDDEAQIKLSDAQKIKKSYKLGDKVQEEFTPKDFGRIAAGTAKQVVTQKLREAERSVAFKEMNEKLEQIVSGIIRRIERDTIYLELIGSQIEGVLMVNDQIPGEKYEINNRLKVYIKKLRETERGTQAIVSRSTPMFVKRLFETEVPEINAGLVTIKNVVREAGYRTKIAVACDDPSIDPLGACVGNKGVRVNTIVAELNGEKIDIIVWSEDPFEFIARALSPAKVLTVEVNDENKSAVVIVPDDKLSLAIGKSGQNVRLAAKLTNWKIDVKSVSQSVNASEQVVTEQKNEITEAKAGEIKEQFTDVNSLFKEIKIDEE